MSQDCVQSAGSISTNDLLPTRPRHDGSITNDFLSSRDDSRMGDKMNKDEVRKQVIDAINEAFWLGIELGGEDYAGDNFNPEDFLPDDFLEEE